MVTLSVHEKQGIYSYLVKVPALQQCSSNYWIPTHTVIDDTIKQRVGSLFCSWGYSKESPAFLPLQHETQRLHYNTDMYITLVIRQLLW